MAKRKTISKLSDLTPDTANANKGTERGRYMVEASLTETGAGRSIVADKDGRIIAGNKTLEAWAGMGGAVKVIETDGNELVVVQRTDLDLSDPKGKARKLAYYDNRAGQVGLEWDAEQLLADVNAGVDLAAMFKADEIAELLAGAGGQGDADAEPQIDQAAELNKKWQVKPGDVWRIGAHRLLCGDSTKAADVARVMGGERADCVMADPPYGMDLDTDFTGMPETVVKSKTYNRVVGDDAPFDASRYIEMFRSASNQFWWGGDYYYTTLPSGGSWIVWDKRNENSDGLVGNHFETCWSMVRHRRYMVRHHWSGVNARNRDIARMHPTEKPIAVIQDIIGMHTESGCIVVDPFAGSGTTLVACENLGRKCRAIEISPAYCAVILERMAQAFPKLEIQRDDAG